MKNGQKMTHIKKRQIPFHQPFKTFINKFKIWLPKVFHGYQSWKTKSSHHFSKIYQGNKKEQLKSKYTIQMCNENKMRYKHNLYLSVKAILKKSKCHIFT